MPDPLFMCRSDGERFDINRVTDVISQLPQFGKVNSTYRSGRGRTIFECEYHLDGTSGCLRIYDTMQSLVLDNSSEVELQIAILINQQLDRLQVPQLYIFDEMYSFCRLMDAKETLQSILGKITTDPMKDVEVASRLK